MSHAIRCHRTGGPDVLHWEPVEIGTPGPSQIRICHTAIGLNFIDTYHRSGLYPLPLPFTPGMEAAGIVEAAGGNVTGLKPGDRVAYGAVVGGYAEERLIDADKVVKIPDEISDVQAAAMMMQGMTAQYLLRRVYPVKAGETILVHAAAGGVGLILCQWAQKLGATVIGTVSSDAKAELAKANGCQHTIVYTRENFRDRLLVLTENRKLPVVYDSIGKDTFLLSLDCLRPLGLMVSFGQASGPVPPFDIGILAQKGSLFLTRPTIQSFTDTPVELQAMAKDLFDAVIKGDVKIAVNQTYPLKDAATAHRDLEARKTTGSTVLTV